MSALYVGLMSGTSLDGVDAVLARFPGTHGPLDVLAHEHQPFDERLRAELLALNSPGPDELHRAALAGNAVAAAYASAVAALLDKSGIHASEVRALGAHGQTVRHRPGMFDGHGYTVQLLNGALLAELSGVAVVCDLRSRDIAAGGQGAPLVPAFHAALFGRKGHDVTVLNIGGISNVSLLHGDGRVGGFDCGPGNCLLDLWVQRHLGQAYDADGAWAASGKLVPDLLASMLGDPFFRLAPPRSTGRDLFNQEWLEKHLAQHGNDAAPADVQATLAELTARCIIDSLAHDGNSNSELLVCGGGALNGFLMERLRILQPHADLRSTLTRGLPPSQVEAAAFAWLAQRHCERLSGNLAAVTGASGLRILGAYHPA
jgi:anhydro-N-acetylmuramic acid kinase